jgi:hypothetical protein
MYVVSKGGGCVWGKEILYKKKTNLRKCMCSCGNEEIE